MSEQAPEPPKPQEGTQEGQQSEQKPETKPDGKAVEFDGPFDEDRAKRLVANLRSDLEKKTAREQDLAAKVKEFEDAQKSAEERLSEDLVKATEDAGKARREALRYKIASRHQISDEDAETFLTGADEDAITKQAERLVALRGAAKPPPAPDLKQGVRSTDSKGQLTRADLKTMKPEEIVQARKEGRMDDLLAGRNKS